MILSRRSTIAFVLIGLLGTLPVAAQRKLPRVLFVCQFGSVKSAIAREMLRTRAAARGLQVETFSRGITPEAHMAPALAAALMVEGIDAERQPLTALSAQDFARADIVIRFDPIPATFRVPKSLDWSDTGSFNSNWQAERTRLVVRIDALIDTLAARRR